jgi:hypothetical protein
VIQLSQTNERIPTTPLEFPVFFIEDRKSNKFTGYEVTYGSTGFTVWGRVPNSKKFTSGHLFDAGGRVFKYSGSSGWLRFSPKVCLILDNLIIPGIISKLFETFGYYGPTLVTEEESDIEAYKYRLVAYIERYGSKDIDQLKSLLSGKSNFVDVLNAVDWWRYHGGKRDEDGHTIQTD